MKHLKLFATLFLLLFLANCDSDDDNTPDEPQIINEEEVITTFRVVLTPQVSGTNITLETRDLDGDGPNPPVITVSGNLVANSVYDGVITLLNETEDPAEDITEEVEEEADEHQLFYTVGTDLNLTTEYSNTDSNGLPLGTQLEVTTGGASTGALTFTLRHEPKKPNDGTLEDAGGETDISTTFNVVVE